MFLKKYKLYPVILFSLFSFPQLMHAQTDSLFLTVDQLFERGVQYSLQLQADAMKESMAQERTDTDCKNCATTETTDWTERRIRRSTRRLGTGTVRTSLPGRAGLVTKLCD